MKKSQDITISANYASTNLCRFFSQVIYSLVSLLIMYPCKKLVVLGLIPLISKYLWKAFCKFSSKSLRKESHTKERAQESPTLNLRLIKKHYSVKLTQNQALHRLFDPQCFQGP